MTPCANDLCVFAVKRGKIAGRLDVRYTLFDKQIVSTGHRTMSLGSLCAEEPCYGTSAAAIERTDENLPKYIRITDFDDFGIEADHVYMTTNKYSPKHILQKGDILFARTGATVGKTYYYDGTIGDAIFAGYCIRFRFDIKKIIPKFIYWYTKTNAYTTWVNGIQRPSGQPNINKEEYKSFEVILPDTSVQIALTAFLDNANHIRKTKIERAEKLIDDSKKLIFNTVGIAFKNYSPSVYSYRKRRDIVEYGIHCNPHSAYLNDLFDHLRANRWYVGHLDEFVSVNPQTDRSTLRESSIVSFVPMPAVDEKINHASYESKRYSEVSSGFTIFKKDDLLWAKITPCMQNGKSFIAADMPTEIGFGSTEFHVLRQKDKRLYMPFLWVLLSEIHVLEAAQGMFSGSAGQQRVPDTFLKKFPIVLPPIEMQKRLADNVFDALSQSKQMQIEAEQEWAEAKVQFEKELLGGDL